MSAEPGQQTLILVCRVQSAARDALVLELERGKEFLERGFRALPTLHFARFLLLPTGGSQGELLFELGFDGLLAPFLAALWASGGSALARLLRHCEGTEGLVDAAAFQRFAAHHALRAEAAYAAHDGLSVAVIQSDRALDRLLQAELDRAQEPELVAGHGPFEIACALQACARATPGTWLESLARGERSVRPDRLAPIRRRAFDVLLAALLVPLLELGRWLRGALRRAPALLPAPEDSVELRTGGAIAQLVSVKPGKLRLFLLRLLLWLAHGWFGQRAATKGHALAHVHNVRWLLRPGPQLLLLAHADVGPATLLAWRGRWERRLSALIWLQTEGFPGAFWSTLTGSRREAALLTWLRATLLPTQFWYSAYATSTVGEIERNHRVRELLSRELDAERARELCTLL